MFWQKFILNVLIGTNKVKQVKNMFHNKFYINMLDSYGFNLQV